MSLTDAPHLAQAPWKQTEQDAKKHAPVNVQENQDARRANSEASNFSAQKLQEGNAVPTNTILVRQLPSQLDKNSLKQYFSSSFGPVRDVRLPQSYFSAYSKAYGFVEFVRVETAQKAVQKAASTGVFYEGCQLEISFASDGVGKGTWDCLVCGYVNFARRRVCKQCNAKKEINDILGVSNNSIPAGDAVLAAKWNASAYRLSELSPLSRYCFDPRSGWYYDPQTLYYVVDPMNLVFYDSFRQQYLKWDSVTGTYLDLPHSNVAVGNADCPTVQSTEKSISQDGVVNNDVQPVESADQPNTESFAAHESTESLSTATDVQKDPAQEGRQGGIGAHQPVKLNSQNKKPVNLSRPRGKILSNIQRWNQQRVERQKILKEFGVDSSDDEEEKTQEKSQGESVEPERVSSQEENEEKEGKQDVKDKSYEEPAHQPPNSGEDNIICEVCRRKFKSQDILEKHIQFSELHRSNVQKQQEIYRDRASERRQLYDSGESEPSQNKRKHRQKRKSGNLTQIDYSNSIDLENSVGAKLMKSMGWKEGEGLGRGNKGISAPIEPIANIGQSGLGLVPLTDQELQIKATDSKKVRLRKETLLRWKSEFEGESGEIFEKEK
eukprot:jgi/Galph1/3550/GphlegSOOS_G2219.1